VRLLSIPLLKVTPATPQSAILWSVAGEDFPPLARLGVIKVNGLQGTLRDKL